MERPDEETLKYVMRSITTNDRQLQREILSRYITDDVKFVHFLGDVKGKDQYYGMYRSAVTGIDYKLQFIDMLISDNLVMAWVDLNIKVAPFFIKRYHAPCIVVLRLRKCPDGLYRIYEQIDHHSVFAFVWALGWPISAISDKIARPISGWLLATGGWSVDIIQDAATAAWVLYTRTLGKAAKAVLPQSWLESVPECIAQPLGLTHTTIDNSADESIAIQKVLTSISGLFQASGLSEISQAVASLGTDDGPSTTAVSDGSYNSAGLNSTTGANPLVSSSSSVYSSGAAANTAKGSSDLGISTAGTAAADDVGGFQVPSKQNLAAAAAPPAGPRQGTASGGGSYGGSGGGAPGSITNKAAAVVATAKNAAREKFHNLKSHA